MKRLFDTNANRRVFLIGYVRKICTFVQQKIEISESIHRVIEMPSSHLSGVYWEEMIQSRQQIYR